MNAAALQRSILCSDAAAHCPCSDRVSKPLPCTVKTCTGTSGCSLLYEINCCKSTTPRGVSKWGKKTLLRAAGKREEKKGNENDVAGHDRIKKR
jgi:hypothetical protein